MSDRPAEDVTASAPKRGPFRLMPAASVAEAAWAADRHSSRALGDGSQTANRTRRSRSPAQGTHLLERRNADVEQRLGDAFVRVGERLSGMWVAHRPVLSRFHPAGAGICVR